MNEMFPGEKIHKVDLHEGMQIRSIYIFCSFVISIVTLLISLIVLIKKIMSFLINRISTISRFIYLYTPYVL